jgi:hypothetical protein
VRRDDQDEQGEQGDAEDEKTHVQERIGTI